MRVINPYISIITVFFFYYYRLGHFFYFYFYFLFLFLFLFFFSGWFGFICLHSEQNGSIGSNRRSCVYRCFVCRYGLHIVMLLLNVLC